MSKRTHEDNNTHITEEECNESQALSEKSPTIGTTGLKNALVKEGKRQEVILLSESDKRKDGKAQDKVTKDAIYQVDDIHNKAIPTLTDQMLKQDPEHHTKAIPVPLMPKESPLAKPQVPNPYKLDLANTIKDLLSQPKSKLVDPELRFNITPEAAASNFEILQ